MIYVAAEQGTQEWLDARLGVVTASRFKDACDRLKSGKLTEKAIKYAAQVAMEGTVHVQCDDTFVTYAMRRGTELEPRARAAYEAETGESVKEAGIYLTDDSAFGYSSDGLVGTDGLIEIKCPLSPHSVISMWLTGDTSEYDHQIQGGLWLTGRKWLDFVMFDPRLEPVGKSLFVKRIHRDEAFIEKMEVQLIEFLQQVAQFRAAIQPAQEAA